MAWCQAWQGNLQHAGIMRPFLVIKLAAAGPAACSTVLPFTSNTSRSRGGAGLGRPSNSLPSVHLGFCFCGCYYYCRCYYILPQGEKGSFLRPVPGVGKALAGCLNRVSFIYRVHSASQQWFMNLVLSVCQVLLQVKGWGLCRKQNLLKVSKGLPQSCIQAAHVIQGPTLEHTGFGFHLNVEATLPLGIPPSFLWCVVLEWFSREILFFERFVCSILFFSHNVVVWW